MQFGKYFLSQQESAWVPHYLNYSRLKKMLKVIARVNSGGPAFGAEGANERVTSLTMTQNTESGDAVFEGKQITEADWLKFLDNPFKISFK